MAALDKVVARFVGEASDGRREAANITLNVLRRRLLEQENDALSDVDLQTVVSKAMKERYLPEAESFLEGMTIADRLSPKNHLDIAQIAIEMGRQPLGISVLEDLAVKFAEDPDLYAEAKGIGGRAHKDLFLMALKGNRAAAGKHLEKALLKYDEGRAGAPEKQNWLIGNLLALGTRAGIEGFPLPIGLNLKELAEKIEESIGRISEYERSFYQWASLAEARLSNKNWQGATDAVGAMLETRDSDIFKLNSTLRQFKDVWLLQEYSDEAQLLLTGLERSILSQPNGEILMDASDIARQRRTNEADLEAQFSNHILRGQRWVMQFLQVGNSVASVVERNSGAVRGTCCIIDGGDVSPEFEGQLLGLTNDHVISNRPKEYRLNPPTLPEHAAVRFTLSEDPNRYYAIEKIIWSSPFSLHDVCLFSFHDKLPIEQSDLKIINYLPPAPTEPPAEIFVISHPNPDEPSYSFQNTDLLMHDGDTRGTDTIFPGLIHYKTGTIKGSSGGVALNARLQMIGLHHAGSESIDRIDGEPGTHAANEAIWIVAILNAIRAGLAKGEDRARQVS